MKDESNQTSKAPLLALSGKVISIEIIDEVWRNEKLSNFINGKIKNSHWNRRVWKFIFFLRKLHPWIDKKLRGKRISRHRTITYF